MITREATPCWEEARGLSSNLQLWDTQCEGLDGGNTKLCLASIARQTRLASDSRVVIFQEPDPRAVLILEVASLIVLFFVCSTKRN